MARKYLHTIPRLEAKERFLSLFSPPDRVERVPTALADGRVTASPIRANRSLPSYPSAAMDGIAVRSPSTFAAVDAHPVVLAEKDYFPVDTGDPLPEGFDAVIPWEELQPLEGNRYAVRSPASPYQHVRAVGEDVAEGEVILPIFHRISPPDLGALLAGGVSGVEVLAKPRVAIVPTGTELVPPDGPVPHGAIPEFNSAVLAAYVRRWDGEPLVFPPVPDDPAQLEREVREALETADVLLINAGSSSGREDFTYTVMGRLGQVLVHGIATRPGKPTILGYLDGKPCLGVPGYPVSAYLSVQWFLYPLLRKWFHQPEEPSPMIRARVGRRVVSELGSEEFVRVSLSRMGEGYVANPLPRGAGITTSLVKADGILVVPSHSQGLEEGEETDIELRVGREEIDRTLLSVGSHDLALEVLSTWLKRLDGTRLTSFHAGSMGGILAIRKGEAPLAGIHLFDEGTGSYNLPFVERYLKGKRVFLVNLSYRTQGLMVERGNPLGIRGVEDLVSQRASFVNRQKGSGTRVLFDYLLKRGGIDPAQIEGYEREEYTHLNVAAVVASGSAHAGMGIYSAARVYGLEFVPLCEERYDLVVEGELFHSDAGKRLLEILKDPHFKAEVEALGGYSTRETGTVLFASNGAGG